MDNALHRLVSLVACATFGLVAACSGAPPEDAPDYELNAESPPSSPPASSSSSGGEGASSSGTSGEAPPPAPAEEDASTSSSSGSSGNGTSSSGSTPPPPPPPAPTTSSAKLDGATLAISETKLWSEVSGPGEYIVFLKVTGPSTPAGSDFIIHAERLGTGCSNTENTLSYRPTGDTQYTVKTAACGLTIDEIPTAVGKRFKGSFKGTLTSINVSPVRTKTVELKFDVLRDK